MLFQDDIQRRQRTAQIGFEIAQRLEYEVLFGRAVEGVSALAEQVKPSARGELEITTLNEMYLHQGSLDVQLMGRGYAWLDTGTMESLLEAAEFVHMVEKRQSVKISAPEEIAYRFGWISTEELLESAKLYGKSPYGQHLTRVAEDRVRHLK